MPIVKEREYRAAALVEPKEGEDYIVEGYATTFEDKYLMLEDGETKYYEMIARNALDKADMSDVIMQYDHEGRVFARQSNGTLELKPDDKGLLIRADLSSTSGSRDLFEDIKSGLITKMSWAFTVNAEEYRKAEHTRIITEVKKVYDVSAVSIPANPDTTIAARNFFSGVAEEERKEIARAEQKAKILEILGKEV